MYANRLPLPADFATVAAGKNITAVERHYRISHKIVKRWFLEAGIKPVRAFVAEKRPVPDDFAQIAADLNKTQLMEYYRVSWSVLLRWIEETGIRPYEAPKAEPKRKRIVPMFNRNKAQPMVYGRVRSLFDDAADVLRRERWTVFRCDDKGIYCPQGKLWRVGNTLATGDELLARAARYRKAA